MREIDTLYHPNPNIEKILITSIFMGWEWGKETVRYPIDCHFWKFDSEFLKLKCTVYSPSDVMNINHFKKEYKQICNTIPEFADRKIPFKIYFKGESVPRQEGIIKVDKNGDMRFFLL